MTAPHVATGRVVFTYQPDGWPVGVITGREDGDTFHVEHVIVFASAPWFTLRGLLRAGLVEAHTRGYVAIHFLLPAAFPLAPRLARVGRRLGFVVDTEDRHVTCYRRAA